MKNVILCLVVALSSLSAYAGKTHCSNSNGSITFNERSYNGGPAPIQGMIMRYQGLSIDGKVVAENMYKYMLPEDKNNAMEWDSNQITIDNSHELAKPEGKLIYANKLTVFRYDGKPLTGTTLQQVSEYMICTSVYDTVPRP